MNDKKSVRRKYYLKNREKILARMKRKYQENDAYREAIKQRAKKRYHEDPEYRERTLRRAKERYRRLKAARTGEAA